ncbi:SusD/RagB family nutrient-binding outer membrane lipoprotein [Fodinibius salsisoli]|uniref:SusD/RagB family nutrient-binding outer membrane lipoprotein n=1 Tax=Fodinibius salsisoli TaxID=2820877 RepID=A0ABT3PSG6_9BACT|nr:SusD/RagB family nutrient-binding outer membrane lipoprotein [Fodinibius salsisoli]MCW9708802.1 SusD/RagB family nutrient-binding outer membrane lipoprotein [Fodinibius salsisoli]
MKLTMKYSKCIALIVVIFFLGSCDEDLTKTNINPNGVSPESANPSLLLPNLMRDFAREYTYLGEGHIAGVVQHMQEDAFKDDYNDYNWQPRDWGSYYNMLRNNKFVHDKSIEGNQEALQAISLTMKSLIYGHITDLWGAAPYTNALKANDNDAVLTPAFDSQENIYLGVIEDLKEAAALFDSGVRLGNTEADLFYNGDMERWHKFANSLILRYSMRVSEKLPEVARENIQAVYQSGIYLQNGDDEVSVPYNEADPWITAAIGTDATDFRRRRPANTLLNKLMDYNDPRLEVWFAPVHVQWVEDTSLDVAEEPTIRRNGERTEIVSLTEQEYYAEVSAGAEFTRRFNPELSDTDYDTREYVGLPTSLVEPTAYNGNPTPGQQVQNQHVSQLGEIFREPSNELVQSRVMTASEVHFILAEAAFYGWISANPESLYGDAIQQSLNTWEVGDRYAEYIANEAVSYNGTLQQIIEQKWISSFTMATESWFDWRRTGYPDLEAGPAAVQPVLPLRFMYGNNELDTNSSNANDAVEQLEETAYSTSGQNSSWSKPWLLQGTDNPW